MNHQLRIELNTAEGATLRTLGLIERRGYRLQTCNLHAELEGRRVLEVMVESDRSIDLLKRQLERLHDVQSVTIKIRLEKAVSNFDGQSNAHTPINGPRA